jgi:hypothetical protein
MWRIFCQRIFLIVFQQNYGDESDAYGLINPSVYSKHGVHEKDFFQYRTPNEVKYLDVSRATSLNADWPTRVNVKCSPFRADKKHPKLN